MIITAKNDTNDVKKRLYPQITRPVFLQVPQLGMFDFAVDLGKRLLAAHGQHGVSEADHQQYERNLVPPKCAAASPDFPCRAGWPPPRERAAAERLVFTMVMTHQMISMTTITVVIFMICMARWLDS